MIGLERVYYDLDNIRKRLVRLVEMERIPETAGVSIMTPVLKLLEVVNGYIEGGVEFEGGDDRISNGVGRDTRGTKEAPD